MYKATRELIKARQPHTEFVIEQVFVKKTNGGIANQCFQNATDDALIDKGNKVVSGWVVNAYDTNTNSTAIVQHWWNIDSTGNYFDTTPNVDETLEYVVDTDIVKYGQDNYDELDNLVVVSLLYKNERFSYVKKDSNDTLVTLPLSSFETNVLFDLSN